jgi:3-oxoadipate enol-lactonase / 4-carboxymuconolactone decarboxylase
VLPRLARHFHVVRYDMRGHGKSDTPAGDYTLDQLTDDLAAVADSSGPGHFHLCGVSMGGMVGMAYAARTGKRLDKLVLSNTSTKFDKAVWETRIAECEIAAWRTLRRRSWGAFLSLGSWHGTVRNCNAARNPAVIVTGRVRRLLRRDPRYAD